jgi:hypothetical protein
MTTVVMYILTQVFQRILIFTLCTLLSDSRGLELLVVSGKRTLMLTIIHLLRRRRPNLNNSLVHR